MSETGRKRDSNIGRHREVFTSTYWDIERYGMKRNRGRKRDREWDQPRERCRETHTYRGREF